MKIVFRLTIRAFFFFFFIVISDVNEGVANKNTVKFKYKPCDKKADLFMLQHEHLGADGYKAEPPSGSTMR